MSLFVKEAETIKIKFYLYFDFEKNIIFARETEEAIENLFDLVKEKIEKQQTMKLEEKQQKDVIEQDISFNKDLIHCIELLVRKPNHFDIVTMLSDSTRNIDGAIGLDSYLYNDLRVRKLMLDWSLKDNYGKKVPLTPETLNDLNQSVYNIIVEQINSKIPLYI